MQMYTCAAGKIEEKITAATAHAAASAFCMKYKDVDRVNVVSESGHVAYVLPDVDPALEAPANRDQSGRILAMIILVTIVLLAAWLSVVVGQHKSVKEQDVRTSQGD